MTLRASDPVNGHKKKRGQALEQMRDNEKPMRSQTHDR